MMALIKLVLLYNEVFTIPNIANLISYSFLSVHLILCFQMEF